MANRTLKENINQAINDFNSIKQSIIDKGQIIENNTKTSDYATKINNLKPSDYILPSGEMNIDENGVYDVSSYESANVNVPIPDGYIDGTETNNVKQTIDNTNIQLGLALPNNDLSLSNLTNLICTHALSDLPYISSVVEDSFTTRITANGLNVVDESYAEIESIEGDTKTCPIKYTSITSYSDNATTIATPTTYAKDSVTYNVVDNTLAKVNSISGYSQVFNQLINPANYPSAKTENNVTFTPNSDGSITVVVGGSVSATTYFTCDQVSLIANHKYLIKGCPSGSSETTFLILFLFNENKYIYEQGLLFLPTQAITGKYIITIKGGCPAGTYIFKPNLIDLTMNGDDNLTLEQAMAKYNEFYPYDSGSIKNALVTNIKSYDDDNNLIGTLLIPSEIQALEGYGWGLSLEDKSLTNYIDFKRKKFVQNVGKIVLTGNKFTLRNTNASGYKVYSASFDYYYNQNTQAICDKYEFKGTKTGISSLFNIAAEESYFYFYAESPNDRYFYIITKEDIIANNAQITVYYQLPTPSEPIDISIDDELTIHNGGTLSFTNSDSVNMSPFTDISYQVNFDSNYTGPYFDGLKNSKLISLICGDETNSDTLQVGFNKGKWCGWYKAIQMLSLVNVTETTLSGITYKIENVNGNCKITLNGTATSDVNIFASIENIIPAGTYYLHNYFSGTTSKNFYINIRSASGTNSDAARQDSENSITTTYDCSYYRIYISNGTTITNGVLQTMVSIEQPSVYLPYTDKPYVEVNGGGEVDLGTLTYSKASYGFYSWSLKDTIKLQANSTILGNIICPIYKNVIGNNIENGDMNICFREDGALLIRDTSCVDIPSLLTKLNGLPLYYQTTMPTYTPLDTNLQYKVFNGGTETIANDNDVYGFLTTTKIKYIINNYPSTSTSSQNETEGE